MNIIKEKLKGEKKMRDAVNKIEEINNNKDDNNNKQHNEIEDINSNKDNSEKT
jgi:hypothetical protein